MAEGLQEITDRVTEKLHEDACTLKIPPPKPIDPTLYSALKVEQTARRIMDQGDVLKFLVKQAQRNHKGDTDVIKHLVASICSTNSATSAGIQPELNGEKGHGKTDAVKAVFHLIPDKWKLSASVSAKALYYHQGLPTGAIIFSDDIEWSEDLISTVKRSMGNFQEPQNHFTLNKDRVPLPHLMPARLAWWLSSVESVANDQLKDRQYSLDIDEGSDHMEEVSNYLRQSRSKKIVRFAVDWRIAVARYIIDDIKSHEAFMVVIDCAEKADWKVTSDHRTQNKFWDLVEAFAILRYRQRVIDSDGWLHALVEDFDEAKTVFMKRRFSHRTHLTNAQTKVIRSVIGLQNEPDGATQGRIAEDLGTSFQAVAKSLEAIEANTKFIVHEKGPHGSKFYRCTVPALEVLYSGNDIVSLPDDYKDSTTFQPCFNHVSTNDSTNIINISKRNSVDVQPKLKEYNNELPENEDSLLCLENRLKRLNEDAEAHNEVESLVEPKVETLCSDRSTLVEPIGVGPNPRKYALPRTVRFQKAHPRFVAEDLKDPGSTCRYGPYEIGDEATLPDNQANILILKGIATVLSEWDRKEVRWT